jgi:Protein of unknown function (DUF2505)
MAKTRIEHTFDCSEATLWQTVFFDDEFSRRLYTVALRFPVWRVLEQKITDETLVRRVEVQPLVENVPGPIKKILGDRFAYVEEGTLDRKKNRYRFRVVPSSMADKTQISGEMSSEPLGENRVKRIVEFNVEVKIMMIGKIIEQKTIDDTKGSYEKMAAFLRSYLKEKAPKTP